MTRIALALATTFSLLAAAEASPQVTRQRIQVTLSPDQHLARLEVELDLEGDAGPLALILSEAAEIEAVLGGYGETATSRPAPGQLVVEGAAGALTLRYVLRFEALEGHADELARGLDAYVGPEGVYLGGGWGWYPLTDRTTPLEVTVTGPFQSVCEGARTAHSERDGVYETTWTAERLFEPATLIAGPYRVTERQHGETTLYAFFYEEEQDLVPRYLDASAMHLDAYVDQLGPYPFSKFAVVENFLPTGYGFPSYTLLGRRVIRLPFIPTTSLRHEIAHCWWGNGVLVGEGGNWCEALATYCADYARAAEEGPRGALRHRWDTLADYASYAREGNELALAEFRARHDGPTRSVGYGKGMLVFHTIRRWIGKEAWAKGLRRLAQERLGQPTSWQDILRLFGEESGADLSWIHAQWIQRAGAPQLELEEAKIEGDSVVVQLRAVDGGDWRLRLPVLLRDAPGQVWAHQLDVTLSAGKAERLTFPVPEDGRPTQLVLDPGFDLFRRLTQAELPVGIRRVLGAERRRIVLPAETDAADAYRALADELARRTRTDVVTAAEAGELRAGDLILGLPAESPLAAALAERLPAGLEITADGFATPDGVAQGDGTLLVGCGATDDGGVALLVAGRSAEALPFATKLLHYGRYAYVIFDGGKAVARVRPQPPAEGPLSTSLR
jgi:hypothetical protein